ncbi:MAG TPA: hypothetical protein VFB73_11065 [Chloroflexota bacterium]|nr:hypothetical protein [Chloroflexota bacterium]
MLLTEFLAQLSEDERRRLIAHLTAGAVSAERAERCVTPRRTGTETVAQLRDYLTAAIRELEAALALVPESRAAE